MEKNPETRLYFNSITLQLDLLVEDAFFDAELLAQNLTTQETLQTSFSQHEGKILPSNKDLFDRTLVHQVSTIIFLHLFFLIQKRPTKKKCCIFGNLTALQMLIKKWGKDHLDQVDFFNTSCAHFAGKKKKKK